MTLDEAIAHAREVASKVRKNGNYLHFKGNERIANECDECAREHEQLASWLEELKARREADRWIPVTERLPEESDFYLVTITDEHITYVNTLFFTKRTAYMWEHDKRIIAWKPLPKPYESEAGK